VLAKSDDLGAHAETIPRGSDEAEFPEADVGPVRLDDEACDPGHLPQALDRGHVAHLGAQDVDKRRYG
jgi:hypothetical protein